MRLLLLIPVLLQLSVIHASEYRFHIPDKPLLYPVYASAYTHNKPAYSKGVRMGALGANLKAGSEYNSVAADWSFLPLGTVFRIKGHNSTRFVVDDHLPSVEGKPIVTIYCETHKKKEQWKPRQVEIEVIRIGDYRASYRSLRPRAEKEPYCYSMAARIYNRLHGLPGEDGYWVRVNTSAIKAADLPKSDPNVNPLEKPPALFPR